MATIFSKIINKEIPCFKIYEDNDFIAILDVNPVSYGHTLIIPKIEIDYIFDINNLLLSKMMPFAKKISKALKLAIPCNRIGVSVIGLEVPHAHMHLIPINYLSDMDFSKERIKMANEEYLELIENIVQKLQIN